LTLSVGGIIGWEPHARGIVVEARDAAGAARHKTTGARLAQHKAKAQQQYAGDPVEHGSLAPGGKGAKTVQRGIEENGSVRLVLATPSVLCPKLSHRHGPKVRQLPKVRPPHWGRLLDAVPAPKVRHVPNGQPGSGEPNA
jgi:hypothetical protein